jgi:hypothetical protein
VDVLVAERISGAGRRGSSRQLVVETSAGARLVKLRGAAQGTPPLVAEIIVAELADAIGLAVPRRSLIDLPDEIETAEWDDEVADLLAASVGMNLGFDYLPGARDVTAGEAVQVSREIKARILWLDRFVINPDRTARNPNLLAWSDQLWLIDHGASLGFHYDWTRVSERSPREPALPQEAHIFESQVDGDLLAAADAELAPRVTRSAIGDAVAAVPDTFLGPLVSGATTLDRRRAAYVAFLWKRIRPPRAFARVRALPADRPRAERPAWLRRPGGAGA